MLQGDPGAEAKLSLTTVDRALRVLTALGEAGSEIGISAISKSLGLSKTVVHRIIVALVDQGYAYRNPETRRYAIGPQAFRIGMQFAPFDHARKASEHVLQELAVDAGSTSYLGVLSGSTVLVLGALLGNSPIRVESAKVGSVRSLYATALGKAILAGIPEARARNVLEGVELIPTAKNTITSSLALWTEIESVRLRGYAVSDEESLDGVVSVGAFIEGSEETSPMAVSVSLPAITCTDANIAEMASRVKRAAAQIAQFLH